MILVDNMSEGNFVLGFADLKTKVCAMRSCILISSSES